MEEWNNNTADLEVITFEGEEYKVLNRGTDNGVTTIHHLASTTQGRYQRNGWKPNQIIVEVPNAS